MLSPKQKAKELVHKYEYLVDTWDCYNDEPLELEFKLPKMKQCALIAVDEIINSSPRYPSNVDWDDCGATHQYYYEEQREEALKFYQEVKTEIEKL